MTRIMLSAKCGVLLTRNRNCFSVTGTSLTSLAATAVALRGARIDQGHLAEDAVLRQRFEDPIAEADFDLAALDDEQFLRGIACLKMTSPAL